MSILKGTREHIDKVATKRVKAKHSQSKTRVEESGEIVFTIEMKDQSQ